VAEEFDLVTDWDIDAPLAEVWNALRAAEAWPTWWPSVRRVELLVAGDAQGVGATHRLNWRTALPYDLVLETEVVAVDIERRIEVRARGDVEGVGIWSLGANPGGATTVRYVWRVSVAKPWMRHLLPLLKPAFAWNHRKVMSAGEAGLQRLVASSDGRTYSPVR
jgi:uncharacterized protein YndB with AHSA1/START domain